MRATMKLTEDHACGIICSGERYRRSFVIPRYTPQDWWECDVFEVTKTGYFREYEVKLSMADFRNDAKKERNMSRMWGVKDMRKKYDMLQAGDPRGPSQFFYVAPKDMIAREQLPQWAGLIELRWIEAHVDYRGQATPGHWAESGSGVAAPRLHKSKLEQSIADHARGVCYYRMHSMWKTLRARGMDVVLSSEPPEVVAQSEII